MDRSLLDELLGLGEAGLTLGTGAVAGAVGMPYGLFKGITGGNYGTREGVKQAEREAQAFMERNTYMPRTEAGQGLLQSLGKAMEASKLPPVIPEAAMLASIPRQAYLAQAERKGMDLERTAGRVVPQVMERGGLPAEMLSAMAQGTQSRALPPKRFQGPLLEGLPEAVEVGGRMEPFGTDQRIVDLAGQYMADRGLAYQPQTIYAPLDVERAKRLADAFDKMKHTPTDKKTQKAYKALAKETQDQYEALLKAGYKFDFIRGADPYGNPRNAINDVVLNKRMSVFPTDEGFGGPAAAAVDISGNPLMARSDLRIGNDPSTTYNDLFRAVHDVFGHAKHGVGFRARGEENAFQSHARMYSPEALPAATSETRGQNSWVNFGPFGAQNRVASPTATEYAAQKTGLMQPWTYQEGLLSDWLWPEGVYNKR
jgi:hypothetical protein